MMDVPSDSIAVLIRVTSSRVAGSPSSSDFVSSARTTAMATSSRPIMAVPMASQTPLCVSSVRLTPKSAKIRPTRHQGLPKGSPAAPAAWPLRTKLTQLCFPRTCGRESRDNRLGTTSCSQGSFSRLSLNHQELDRVHQRDHQPLSYSSRSPRAPDLAPLRHENLETKRTDKETCAVL